CPASPAGRAGYSDRWSGSRMTVSDARDVRQSDNAGTNRYLPGVRQIVILRGINLGPRNRIAMPALREQLGNAGLEDPRTYLQSGNVVLSSDLAPEQLAGECKRVIAESFGLDIDVLARSRDELAEIVARNPLAKIAVNPTRYQVTFLSHELGQQEVQKLASLATGGERLVSSGRELYAWHPAGVARSRLWARLGGQGLGVSATSRNWTTVEALLELADA
ncbi:MAG: DUF1697 domain-containing protein, partial [Solirubrobacteraceae bacterium]